MSAISDTQDTKVGIEAGGDRGFVKSGGAFDFEAGTGFKIGGVDVTARLSRVGNPAAREVDAAAATLTVTEALHDGRTVLLDRAGGVVATLPAATGSGDVFRFVVKTVAAPGPHKVLVANGTDIIQGTLAMLSDDGTGGPNKAFTAGATDDTISLNGTTTGGKSVGDWIEIEDVAAGLFICRGQLSASGAESTAFSSTV